MNISVISAAAGTTTILCVSVRVNRADPLGPLDGTFSLDESRILQEDEAIRALQKVYSDRMNKATKVAFDTSTELASIAAAEAMVLTWPRKVPNFGTIVFTTDTSGGSTTWYLVNAGIKNVRCKNMGLSVTTHYEIDGGTVSANLQGT